MLPLSPSFPPVTFNERPDESPVNDLSDCPVAVRVLMVFGLLLFGDEEEENEDREKEEECMAGIT